MGNSPPSCNIAITLSTNQWRNFFFFKMYSTDAIAGSDASLNPFLDAFIFQEEKNCVFVRQKPDIFSKCQLISSSEAGGASRAVGGSVWGWRWWRCL